MSSLQGNELPSVYYVYSHVDPETEELIYIGKGSRGRAWHCAETNSRGVGHAAHLDSLILKGYTPDSWVHIIESALTNEQAFALESELLWAREQFPKYNSPRDFACKLSKEIIQTAKNLRDEGKYYSEIAKILGFSTMTIYRVLNGKTKNYN
jgi:hypothetical protein